MTTSEAKSKILARWLCHRPDAIVTDLQAAFPGNSEEISRSTQAFIDMAQDKGWLHF